MEAFFQTAIRGGGESLFGKGDVRGGISVSIVVAEILQEMRGNSVLLILSALGIIALIITILYFILRVFIKDLREADRKLVEMATKDNLTGLLNRREALRRIEEEFSRSHRTLKPISFALIDVDHFKKINDTYGHSVGDHVLQTLAAILQGSLREYDILCRYGGEEFLIAFPETDRTTAKSIAERLRMSITEKELSVPVSSSLRVSVSIGVAQTEGARTIDQAISGADNALYAAKEKGRNQVAVG
jgi:diguanylate cyclase (GGDEF)-like protein